MSLFSVPVFSSTLNYDEIVQLDGREYSLRFLWHDRELSWYLDIGDQSGDPIASSIRIVVGFPLLRRFIDPRLPGGDLIAVDMTGNNMEIAVPTDLGARVHLLYISADDPLLTGV